MGLLGNDLWPSGHELEPGVEVLDGLFSASEEQSILDFPSAPDTVDSALPDFQASRPLHVLVHCIKKKVSIGQSCFVYLSLCSAQFKTDFDDALTHTQLMPFVHHWTTLTHSSVTLMTPHLPLWKLLRLIV